MLLKKILRGSFTIIGLALGWMVASELMNSGILSEVITKGNIIETLLFYIFSIIIIGFIFFIGSPWVIKAITRTMEYFERSIQRLQTSEIVFGTIGGIIGLIISVLVVSLFPRPSQVLWLQVLWTIIEITICIIVAAFAADVTVKKREEIMTLFSGLRRNQGNKEAKEKKVKGGSKGSYKVLDTSVIIDGRIFDICQTGFIEGTIVIPTCVLDELRHIADSSDGLKRNRGRRGLDVLNRIQKELNIEVQIYEKDFPDIAEVDIKLLKLAQVLNGKVITNDYNLNKVAEVKGVPVLNINELANAVKPVVLPGEEMTITIVKDGKESGQGVAYLDDGTMIVVEGGRKHMGETLPVAVTSVLQTAAGRMIFAKQKEA